MNTLKIILAILFAIIFVAVVVFVIILVCNYGDYWFHCCCGDMIKVPFSVFKQVYLAVPEQFELDKWRYKNHRRWYTFGYFDAIRYELFRQFEDKRRRKRNNVTGYKEFLENAQHDIEEKQRRIHEETIRDLQEIRDEVAKK